MGGMFLNQDFTTRWAYIKGTGSSSVRLSGTITLGFVPAAGTLLVCQAFSTNLGQTLSVSDDSSGPADTWTEVVPAFGYPGVGGTLRVWATNVTSGTAPTAVTCTQGSSSGLLVSVDAYLGAANPFVQDGTAGTAYRHAVTISVSKTTGATAGGLVWSSANNFGAGTSTVTQPFTHRILVAGNCGITSDCGIQDGVAASTPYTATYSSGPSNYWLAAAVAFRAA
jgi:hypothetical protein